MSLFSCVLLASLVGPLVAQYHYPPRRGSPQQMVCPPPLPVGVCGPSCSPGGCPGFYMCCPTDCGGLVCSRPVTTARPAPVPVPAQPKNAVCPEPKGPWVCTNRCSTDQDCPWPKKCCLNRCGALACVLP